MAAEDDRAGRGAGKASSRRRLLARGAGALAAVLTAEALARPAPAAADNGNPVILGGDNTETGPTYITTSDTVFPALVCQSAGEIGLSGSNSHGNGVSGDSAGYGNGVTGTASGTGNGVAGLAGPNTGGDGVFGISQGTGNGVHGSVSNAAASGVYGQNDGTGFGVAGRAAAGVGVLGDSANGVGVWASSQNATALQVSGTAVFSRSGLLTVAAGKSSATVTGVALAAASLVLATLQQNLSGVYVRAAVPNTASSSLTVYLSKAPSASTKVAWFVVS